MRTETAIKVEGMKILRQALGLVDAEKFILLMRREPFDYTEWQTHLWEDRTVDQLFDAARRRGEGLPEPAESDAESLPVRP